MVPTVGGILKKGKKTASKTKKTARKNLNKTIRKTTKKSTASNQVGKRATNTKAKKVEHPVRVRVAKTNAPPAPLVPIPYPEITPEGKKQLKKAKKTAKVTAKNVKKTAKKRTKAIKKKTTKPQNARTRTGVKISKVKRKAIRNA